MKFFAWFFGFFLLLAAIALGIYYLTDKGPELGQRLESGMSATFVDERRNRPATDLAQQATAPAQVNPAELIRNAAIASGVTVQSSRTLATNQVEVTISWGGANTTRGGDFLDALLRQGRLRDFDDRGSLVSQDRRGRNVYSATYVLYLQ